MKYYKLDADLEQSTPFGPVDEAEWKWLLDALQLANPITHWRSFRVAPILEPDAQLMIGDVINFNATPVALLSESARTRLGPCLAKYGELLPVESDYGKFFVFHAMNEIDALDKVVSKVSRYASGHVRDIENYAFNPGVIGSSEVFRIPESSWQMFATDSFRSRVSDAQIRGFEFCDLD